MPRSKNTSRALTPLELEIMIVLWRTGPGARELAYTTVQTMLNVLHRKGRVKRELRDRAYVYRPVLSRQKAVRQSGRRWATCSIVFSEARPIVSC